MSVREEVYNTILSEILNRRYGLNSIPENIINKGKRREPDISILIDGVRLIIEGRKEKHSVNSLKEKAKERINQNLADISVALLYPKEIERIVDPQKIEDFLINIKYKGYIFYQEGDSIKENSFNQIDIRELSQIINNIVSMVISETQIMKYVKEVDKKFLELIDKYLASSNLFYNNQKVLNTIIDTLQMEINLSAIKKRERDLYKILLFILLDALLLHGVVSINIAKIKPLSSKSTPVKQFLIDEWKKVLKIDYEPIFKLAYRILVLLPDSPQIDGFLNELIAISQKIISSGILRKHDFLGRLYHKILLKTSGKFYATYYTAIPSAILLSELLIKTKNSDWKFEGINDIDNFKLIDPACGSGTLLTACYKSLKDLFIGKISPFKFSEFHKKLVENVIYGFDVLDYASHLTLTNLIMHNPKVLVFDSNIYTVPNGCEDSKVYLGSLSYLKDDAFLFAKSWTKIGVNENRQVRVSGLKKEFNVVIMNPPFTRSAKPNIKFGYSSKEVKELQRKELSLIIKQLKLTGIGQAGFGPLFIYLGHVLLKQNGRMGVVIPRSFLSGVSSSKIRELLNDNYEIKFIFSNHDPGDKEVEGWNWSEHTQLGEIMFIAEKTQKKDKEVTYINLWEKPSNELEAYLISAEILNKLEKLNGLVYNNSYEEIKINNRTVGTFYKVQQEDLTKYGWLLFCLFANPHLNVLVKNLHDILKKESLYAYIKESSGIDIKQIKDNFEETDAPTQFRIIWGQQQSMNTLLLKNRFIGYGKPKKVKSATLYNKATNFFVSGRPHLNNDALIAFQTSENCLATALWEIILKDEFLKYLPLITLWLNSTYGLLLYLSISTNSQGQIFKTKKSQLRLLHIPDFKFYENINNHIVKEANRLYEEIKDENFMSFPEEFKLASKGMGLRKLIDDFFKDKLSLINLEGYYPLLSKEPIFTLKRLNLKGV